MPDAVTYGRVSSEQQAGEKQTSLADQDAALEALAARLASTIVERFVDAGISGATVAKRPGLRALLAYCAANRRPSSSPGYVLVLNDSRFGRFADPDEAASLRFALKRDGWLVRFAEADESNDPTARHVMRAIGSAQASQYRANLQANSIRGRTGTTKQGFWATRPPFGYRRAVVFPAAHARVLEHGQAKARGEKIKLTPGPDAEVALVRDVFARYATGAYSITALARWLNTHPAAVLGRRPWAATTLQIVLSNHAYVGAIPARRRTAERMSAGDYARRDPEYVVWDAHPALIDRETFDGVQAQLAETPMRGDVFDYRLRGLVRCDTCGEPLMGGGLGSRLASTGQRVRFYVCGGGRAGTCPPRATCVSSHLLEGAVITAVAAHVTEQVSPAAVRKAFTALLQPVPSAAKSDTQKARQRALARRDRLVTAIAAGTLTDDEARGQLDAIRAELLALETSPTVAPDAQALRSHLDRLVARGRDFASLAAAATGPELRALVRPWIATMSLEKQTRVLSLTLRTAHAVLAPNGLRAGD